MDGPIATFVEYLGLILGFLVGRVGTHQWADSYRLTAFGEISTYLCRVFCYRPWHFRYSCLMRPSSPCLSIQRVSLVSGYKHSVVWVSYSTLTQFGEQLCGCILFELLSQTVTVPIQQQHRRLTVENCIAELCIPLYLDLSWEYILINMWPDDHYGFDAHFPGTRSGDLVCKDIVAESLWGRG